MCSAPACVRGSCDGGPLAEIRTAAELPFDRTDVPGRRTGALLDCGADAERRWPEGWAITVAGRGLRIELFGDFVSCTAVVVKPILGQLQGCEFEARRAVRRASYRGAQGGDGHDCTRAPTRFRARHSSISGRWGWAQTVH